MGRKFQYTTLDRVISKLYRDLGLTEISETDVVEWTGEALEAIGAVGLYEPAVVFLEVKDHKVDLPKALHAIIQIAKHNTYTPENAKLIVPLDNTTLDTPPPVTACGLVVDTEGYPVPLDCNGVPVVEYDIAYYRPFFNLQNEYIDWNKSAYTPVRLADHSFFNTIVCTEQEDIYISTSEEYTIIEDTIRTSFLEGLIAVAYYKQKIDDSTGYPLIPDDYSIITAITKYITMKYMSRLWYLGREGYGDKVKKAEEDWQWYCRQAGNKIMAPYGIDEYQNILEATSHLLPNKRKYYGFFGRTNLPGTSF